ncbi:MAG: NACHT domain-containing protein [Schwartzia sp.]|nr:NACHT domain-containing protein [Schwartzia sp. (in: firmicutes)]
MNLHIASKQGGRRGTVLSLMKNEIEENRMILWGVAGAGKTTTLRYLAYEDAANFVKNGGAGKLPVLISLGMTTNEDKSIKDYIKTELSVDDETLENLLETEVLVLYFDGFNEIPYTERQTLKKKRRMELTEMIRNYPDTFMLFTDRPEDGEEFQSVPVFDLLPMDDAQITEFINKHIREEEDRKILRETIEKDKNLKELVKRPFILSMLIAIAPNIKNIHLREGVIIGEFLKQLFRREVHEKYDENLDEKKMTLLLRRIGYESFEKSKTNSGMSEEEIIAIMNRCQKEYKFDYDNLYALKTLVHLGILNKRGGSYVFAHQRYQDYYNSLELTAIFGEEL